MLNRTIAQVLRDDFVVTLPPDATVREAAQVMSAKHVASVVICGTEAQVDGIFTERDLIDRVVAPSRDPDAVTLKEVMSKHPVTISPEQTVRQALAEMKDNDLRHLPVMRAGSLVGVVSMRDFIGDEIAEMDHERELSRLVWEHAR